MFVTHINMADQLQGDRQNKVSAVAVVHAKVYLFQSLDLDDGRYHRHNVISMQWL